MIILYRLFIWLYKWGAECISPFNKKAQRWLKGRQNIFELLEKKIIQDAGSIIWFHCASLGEFEQARTLIETVRHQFPNCKILLTFFSPSGYEIRKNYTGADFVFYLPMDSKANAARFLQIVNPILVIWIKYEYWHYYLAEIKNKKIPLLLVSGVFRDDQPFFKWYGAFYRKMLANFSWLFVQNTASKDLLKRIGISDNVSVSGDTRFDRVIEIASQFKAIAEIDQFIGNAKVIVAGSTWEEDEEELDHFANTNNAIKFIIVPHEIEESHLTDIEKLFRHSIRFSVWQNKITKGEWAMDNHSSNVLIIDNIGMLASLYHYATISYVGGGFGNDGVHNVLEAAVYGKPVIFGPVYEKYAEAIGLVECGAAFSVENSLELEENLKILLNDEDLYKDACASARQYVLANQGATEKVIRYIQEKRLLTN